MPDPLITTNGVADVSRKKLSDYETVSNKGYLDVREGIKTGIKEYNQNRAQGGSDTGGGSGIGGQAPGWMNAVGGAVSGITKAFTAQNKTVDQGTLKIRDSISDAAIQSGVPIAMAIGAATKIVDAIGDSTGFHIDDIDKDAAKKAGVSGMDRFMNNAMNALPGFSALLAIASPTKTHETNAINSDVDAIASGYAGTMGDINSAQALSGKRTLFTVGQREMNKYIDEQNRKIDMLNKIANTNTLAKNSTSYIDVAQQNANRYAGTTYNFHAVGKNGMKLLSKKELNEILKTRKLQLGGVIGMDTNLIPDGSLHARLNHLQDSPDLEDTTRKGIPVLDENGEQVAEIECEELILSKTLTEKIEQLAKDGSDESVIECGKILTEELLSNTQDNTGRILENTEDGK